MREQQLWTTHDIAAYLGWQVGSVNSWLVRHDIKRRRVTRDQHGRTVNLYDPADIRQARPSGGQS